MRASLHLSPICAASVTTSRGRGKPGERRRGEGGRAGRAGRGRAGRRGRRRGRRPRRAGRPGGVRSALRPLFRIARNVATDAHRRRRPALDIDLLPERLDIASDDDPEVAALRRERVERLREQLATLDPDKRELLGLRFAAGLSSREIAPVVGRSEAAVKKQITRIIQQLREQYGDA